MKKEIGMKKHLTMKVVESRLRWTGDEQRMSGKRVAKRAWKTEESVRRRQTDIKIEGQRDLERAEVNSREWERTAEYRNGWRRVRRLVERAEQTKLCGPHVARDQGEEDYVH